MSRVCELTGKRRQIGNTVSHANNKKKTKNQVNLHNKKVFDATTGRTITLRLSASAIRSLDKIGSVAKFLKKYKNKN